MKDIQYGHFTPIEKILLKIGFLSSITALAIIGFSLITNGIGGINTLIVMVVFLSIGTISGLFSLIRVLIRYYTEQHEK